jgi:putative DNA primase/helicase
MTPSKSSSNTRNARQSDSELKKTKPHKPAAGRDLKVVGFSDQTGAKWIEIAEGVVIASARLDLLNGEPSTFYKDVSQQGVVVVSQATKAKLAQLVEAIREWPQTRYIAERPGFHAGVFVKPDGTVIGKPTVPDFYVHLDPETRVPLAQAGSLEAWQKAVRRFVRGQPIPILSVCLGFTGPILSLTEFKENIGFELWGGSSTGKSTMLDLLASVSGAPLGVAGSLATTWLNTGMTIQVLMAARSGLSLALDEGGHLGSDAEGASGQLSSAVHFLGAGVTKGRKGIAGESGVAVSWLSTSNKPLAEIVGKRSADPTALAVRLINIFTGKEKTMGVWATLPKGALTTGDASNQLKAALRANHGWAIDLFLNRLVKAIQNDEDELKASIARHVARFLKKAAVGGQDGPDLRVAQKFAVVYAAGRLASDWDILPVNNLWESLLKCFRQWQAAQLPTTGNNPTAHERVLAYADTNAADLFDLDAYLAPPLTARAMDTHAGFLKTVKTRRCLLIRPARWEAIFGQDAFNMLTELKKAGLLLFNDGRQYNTKIRKSRTMNKVYAVVLKPPI